MLPDSWTCCVSRCRHLRAVSGRAEFQRTNRHKLCFAGQVATLQLTMSASWGSLCQGREAAEHSSRFVCLPDKSACCQLRCMHLRDFHVLAAMQCTHRRILCSARCVGMVLVTIQASLATYALAEIQRTDRHMFLPDRSARCLSLCWHH